MVTRSCSVLAIVCVVAMVMACNGKTSPTALVGAVEVHYVSGTPIAGFQFRVTGAEVADATGGTAAATGFTLDTGNNIVLGFSLSGATIPAGSGVLVVLELTGSGEACLTDLVVSDSSGNALNASVENCLTVVVP